MTPSRPYLIRALYDWILDNELTPLIVVNAEAEGVQVPESYIREGRICLNIKPSALDGLSLGNEMIEFKTRFHGVIHLVSVPVEGVIAIYAQESGRGMIFSEEPNHTFPPSPASPAPDKGNSKKPNLKVIK